MKLTTYTVEVHCPDDWDDSNWSDAQQRKLDVLLMTTVQATALGTTRAINDQLSVVVHD